MKLTRIYCFNAQMKCNVTNTQKITPTKCFIGTNLLEKKKPCVTNYEPSEFSLTAFGKCFNSSIFSLNSPMYFQFF